MSSLEIPRLPESPRTVSIASLGRLAESHIRLSAQKHQADFVGMIGLAITMTLLGSGVYAFFRYLL